jgi:hypothetical protein
MSMRKFFFVVMQRLQVRVILTWMPRVELRCGRVKIKSGIISQRDPVMPSEFHATP